LLIKLVVIVVDVKERDCNYWGIVVVVGPMSYSDQQCNDVTLLEVSNLMVSVLLAEALALTLCPLSLSLSP
jgi:hypothetical protein